MKLKYNDELKAWLVFPEGQPPMALHSYLAHVRSTKKMSINKLERELELGRGTLYLNEKHRRNIATVLRALDHMGCEFDIKET